MPYQPLRLNWSIAPDVSAEPFDLVDAKRALGALGYYGGALEPHVDDELFEAIARFQEDNGLPVDRLIKPDGPTQAAINLRLAERRPDRVRTEVASRLPDFASRKEIDDEMFGANRRLAERLERGDLPKETVDWVSRSLLEGDASEAIQTAGLVAQSPRLARQLGQGEQLLAVNLAGRRRKEPNETPQEILDLVRGDLRKSGGRPFASVDDVNRPRGGDAALFRGLSGALDMSIELGEGRQVRLLGADGFALSLPRAVVRALAADPYSARLGLATLIDWRAGRLSSEQAIRDRFTRRGGGVGRHASVLDEERYHAFMDAEAARREGVDDERVMAALAPIALAQAFEDAEARSSLLLDLLPVIGNLRSANEAADSIARLRTAIQANDFSRIGVETLNTALAAVGALPGGSLPVGAVKRLLQPALREAPVLGKVLAQKRVVRYMEQFPKKLPTLPPEKILGSLFTTLPAAAQRSIKGAFPNIHNAVTEREAVESLKTIGFTIEKGSPENKTFGRDVWIDVGGTLMKRRYDAILENKLTQASHWLWLKIVEAERGRMGLEVKANQEPKSARQNLIDSNSAGLAKANFDGVIGLRIATNQVPEKFLLERADELLSLRVDRGDITEEQKIVLLRGIRNWHRDQNSSGTVGAFLVALARASNPEEEKNK